MGKMAVKGVLARARTPLRKRVCKLVEGCPTCESIRMKPAKAWAVVRDRSLQGEATGDMYVMLVFQTKDEARKRCVDRIDRVARVEIREV